MDSTLEEQGNAHIYSADLSSVLDRLVYIDNWSKKNAIVACQYYRNYLFLRKKYPNQDLLPSREIDDVWHAHILHTEEYERFCTNAFGYFLHHHPHLTKIKSKKTLEQLFYNTQSLYYLEFGDYLYSLKKNSMPMRIGSLFGSLLSYLPIKNNN